MDIKKSIFRCYSALILICIASLHLQVYANQTQPTWKDIMRLGKADMATIQTGELELEYRTEEHRTDADLAIEREQQRLDYEGLKKAVESNPKLSQKDAEQVLKANRKSMLAARPKNILTVFNRTYLFDRASNDYRMDESLIESSSEIEQNQYKLRTIITSQGCQTCYYPDLKQLVITYFNNDQPNDLPIGMGILKSHFKNDPISEENEIVVFENKSAIRYTVNYENNEKVIAYVDPKIGYRYLKVEFIKDKTISRVITASQYKIFDGIPIPSYYKDVVYDLSDSDHRESLIQEIRLFKAKCNSKIDHDVFKIHIPNDVHITDTKLGIVYTLNGLGVGGNDAESYSVDDLVSKSVDVKIPQEKLSISTQSLPNSTQRDSPFKKYSVILVFLLCVCIVALVIWLKARR